jgi:CBS-domain-containing membrane protein
MFNRTQSLSVLAGAVGGAVAIAVMEAFSIRREVPLWAIPFATSIVLVMGSPEADTAQPRALVGGHLISTIVGLIFVKVCGPDPWVAALAVGLSMIAMHLSGTFHPPAGIDPLVVVVNDLSALSIRPSGNRCVVARIVRLRLAQTSRAKQLASLLVVMNRCVRLTPI